MTLISLQDEQFTPLLADVVPAIVRSGFPGFLASWERYPYGLGPKSHAMLRELERASCTLLAVHSLLSADATLREAPKTAQDLLPLPRLAAVHAAAVTLAGALDEQTQNRVRAVNALPIPETRAVLAREPLPDVLLRDAFLFVRDHVSRGHEAPDALCAYAHLLASYCRMQYQDPRYQELKSHVESLQFQIGDLFYTPFSNLQKVQSQLILPVRMEDIVGNDEFLAAGRRLVRDLLAFDPRTGENPRRMNPILFALGKPGCGKTASAHALGRHLIERAREAGLLAKFCVIRRTDWASAYQNASASALIARFTGELSGFPGVVAFYWPDIDTAFGTRVGGDLRPEEKSILGAAFGLFDGTLLPHNGQWILVCDANYMQMDDATISRLAQQPYLLEGPVTPAQYTQLVRDHLLGPEYAPLAGLSEKQWREFGRQAAAAGLSGRDCAHFARRLCALMEDVEYPPGFFDADPPTRREMLKKSRRRLDAAAFWAQYKYVLDFVSAARRREEEEQVDQLVREWIRNEKARRRALARLETQPEP